MDNQRLSLSLGDPVADYYNRISLGQPVPERPRQPVVEAAPQVESRRAVVEEKQPAALLPEEEHTQKMEDRMRRRAEAMAYINNQVISLPKDMREITFKSMLAYMDERYPKINPFDETPAAKSIMSELPNMRAKDTMIQYAGKELAAASKMEDKKEKMARVRAIVPKLIQSIGTGGPDALQQAEIIFGAPEMQTFFTWAQGTNRSITDPRTLTAFFADPAIQSSQFFQGDPDKYIAKAKGVYNSFVETRNERLDQFRNMTSERWMKANTGFKKFDRFEDADSDAENSSKQIFGQSSPVGGTMSSGYTMTGSRASTPSTAPVGSGTQTSLQPKAPEIRGHTRYKVLNQTP